jgi:acyl-coenzyme A thioesterase PaaI-like protein
VVSRGKNIGYLECEIVDDAGGKQIAKASSTCFVLRGEQSKQR